MMDWITSNWIELTGVNLAFLYLILEVRRKWPMWIVGIFSSAFYVYIFYNVHLFANMGLNVFYTLMSFYGLYCWKFSKTNKEEDTINFHFISKHLAVRLGILFVVLFAFIYWILTLFPESEVPIPDALIAALSIVATWMTARKIVECWYLWISANYLGFGLYMFQGLFLTSILYLVYANISIFGFMSWRKFVLKR